MSELSQTYEFFEQNTVKLQMLIYNSIANERPSLQIPCGQALFSFVSQLK